jgi:hypothetical protein
MTYLVIYLVVSWIITLILSRGNIRHWLFRASVVTFLPGIGWLIPSIWVKKGIYVDENYFSSYMNDQIKDLKIDFKEAKKTVNREKELNILPIKEALIINDHSTRRKVLIDILKIDAYKYIDSLKVAVLNDDTETSHYAVTAISEEKRKLVNILQKLAVDYEHNRDNEEFITTYADIINSYKNSGFLDDRTRLFYENLYNQLLQSLISKFDPSEKIFEAKITSDLILQTYDLAEMNAKLFIERYPACETAYLKLLEVFYTTKSFTSLNQTLSKLKKAPITLSNEALKIVRYWSEVIPKNEVPS